MDSNIHSIWFAISLVCNEIFSLFFKKLFHLFRLRLFMIKFRLSFWCKVDFGKKMIMQSERKLNFIIWLILKYQRGGDLRGALFRCLSSYSRVWCLILLLKHCKLKCINKKFINKGFLNQVLSGILFFWTHEIDFAVYEHIQ